MARSPIKKVAENSTLNIRIRNIGETPKEEVLVQVQIKNLKRTLSLDIPANGMQQTKLNYKEEGQDIEMENNDFIINFLG